MLYKFSIAPGKHLHGFPFQQFKFPKTFQLPPIHNLPKLQESAEKAQKNKESKEVHFKLQISSQKKKKTLKRIPAKGKKKGTSNEYVNELEEFLCLYRLGKIIYNCQQFLTTIQIKTFLL